jgi:hypothetical protein
MNVAARERFEECDEARMAVMSSLFAGMKRIAPAATGTRHKLLSPGREAREFRVHRYQFTFVRFAGLRIGLR